MNFIYENQGTNTYLVYEIGANDALDSMSLGMLTNNDIHGLAKTLFTQMDEKKFIRYNVSAKVSGAQFFAGVVNRKRLLGVFKGIVDAMLSAEEYMLDPNTIVLDMNYIFADVSTCETVLICLPVMGADLPKTDLSTFFRNIMFSTQFDQTENCDHVTHILNHLNRTPVLSLPEFKNLLDTLSAVQEPTRSAPQKQQPEAPRPAVQPQKVVQTPPASVQAAGSGIRQAPPAPKAPVVPVTPPAPPVVKPAAVPVAQAPQNASGEKDISLFYLLQHYNKENAAAYKAQKEAKKGQTAKPDGKKAAKQEKKEKKEKKQKKQKEQAAPKMASPSFAIPGQPDAPAAPPVQQIPPVQPPVAAKPVQPQAVQPVVQQPQVTVPPVQVQQAPVQNQAWQPAAKEGKAISFGETTVLGEQVGGTVILGAAAAAKMEPHLIRMKNNEKIPIDKPVFRIGKERNYADYFIADNPSVSRSHANIINRDGELFVVDTNSTNRTYVDGVAISSNVETKLAHGTKLRFANVDFEFRLY